MMVTHDHRIIDAADRLVHMVDGRIMSDVVLHDALRICEFLRPIQLFKTLTPRQLTDVAEKMSKRHYDAGETIIRKGDLGKEFFLVSDGEVEVIRADQEVALLGPGDFFGEVALISGEPRNATVVARNAVDTYVLGKTDFEAALATSQSFRDQLYGIYSCGNRDEGPKAPSPSTGQATQSALAEPTHSVGRGPASKSTCSGSSAAPIRIPRRDRP